MSAPRTTRVHPRSLRFRAVSVVLAVVVLPVLWVWFAGADEATRLDGLQAELAVVASRLADGGDDVIAAADAHQARIRVLDGETVVTDADAERADPWHAPVSNPFYGPDGRPDPAAVDALLPPLHSRAEVAEARRLGVGQGCTVADRWMLVCAAAAVEPGGRVVHVQRSSARLIKSLYEDRYPLTAVMLVVLAVGVLLALWLGWRMVGPIETLRDQVVERTRGRVSTEPVVLDRADELGDLARAFNQLLAALDARNRANEAFAADLAHELKNPVAAVRAAAEAMAADRPLEGRRRERLTRVLDDSARRMQVVIDRFLDLARAEAGLVATAREPLDLAELVAAVVAPFRSDPRFADLTFTVDVPPLRIAAAHERLETALRNLVGNAASYAERRVTITGGSGDRRATLVVADDGPGIAPDDAAQIFDRYYTTRDTGTGLGLALVRAIVEAHGGFIEVESAPGEGARFTIKLPHAD